jgi:hypothetical protein
MPDSQVPPLWGPAYDERDLDALLSGQPGSTPAALQPVESTLAALRVGATGRELSDEAMARAAFRAFTPPPPPPPAPLPWTAAAEHPGVTAHTLVLPPAGREPRRPTRHRHRRPAAKGARRPGIALAGTATAALIVVAVVVTSALTGSIGDLTSFGRQPASASATARATGQSPGSQGLLATGAARDRPPSPKPTAVASPTPQPTPSPASLCREYYAYLGHPTPGGGEAWATLGEQLSKLAGSPFKVGAYCLRYLVNPIGPKGVWPPPGTNTGGNGAGGAQNTGTGGVASAGNQGSATTEQRQGMSVPGQSGDSPAAAGRP